MSIRDTLEYSNASRFFGPKQFDTLPANELTYALRSAVKECTEIQIDGASAQFEGAYVLQDKPQSPAIPVVYVVTVNSDALARRVHQFVWNQNQTPFLIVESPSTVRLYSGFSFRENDQPLCQAVQEIADILAKLAEFRAEAIDDGTLWKKWAHAVKPSERVDETLLRDLKKLDVRLQEQFEMDRNASHGLIGKYVYLSYLRHRGILSDTKLEKWKIVPEQLFTENATLKAFHNVNENLQEWLNGSVFSLEEDAVSKITVDQLKIVARVFKGDSPSGTIDVQPTLFECYDFSHIPIETLSCVYEQFLHDAKSTDGRSRGKTLGAYYTPLPLTDYVLSEMDRRRPLKPGMTVLDPACGSGAFLVQCYRRLIERQRRIEARELKAKELRDLLTEHIFGIDRDGDACRVAELSLIMTLLDYIEPPDLENTNFKLPALRNQNIVQGDFFDLAGPTFDLLSKRKFDWIVGNPPWAEVKGKPGTQHEHYTAHQWIITHKKTHPTSGKQLAEAFIWKAGEHLAKEGVCGLVVLAMTWFKKEATTFRQRFFSERRVWCLANFANLAYVLFAGRSERPASVVFFESEKPSDDHIVRTFAPFVAEQVANRPEKSNPRLFTWNITVSSTELREIDQSEVSRGDSLTWKLAMWGNHRDRKLLVRLDSRFANEKFDSLLQLGIEKPHQGLELRAASAAGKEELEHHPNLVGKKKLLIGKLRGTDRIFNFPDTVFSEITSEDCYIRKGRSTLSLKVSQPPHIVVDASRRFAIYADSFIAIPPMQIGITGSPNSAVHLRALSLFLSSDFCTYHQFLISRQWGIDANRAGLNSLMKLPVPLARLTANELLDWSSLQQELATTLEPVVEDPFYSLMNSSSKDALTSDLNDRVYKLIGLRKVERWLVEDFVHLHMKLNKGKVANEVMRMPTDEELRVYLFALRECLDAFLSTERGLRHGVEVLADSKYSMLRVALIKSKISIAPVIVKADDPASRSLKTIRDQLRSQHSQWIYFDRSLKVYEPQTGVLYLFKPLQRLHWTRRQAVLDADEIIAETLIAGGVS